MATFDERYRELKHRYPPIRDDEFVFPKDEPEYQRKLDKRLRRDRFRRTSDTSSVDFGQVIGVLVLIVLAVVGVFLLYRIALFAFTGHFTR